MAEHITRREMFQQGFQSLSKLIPGALGIASELGGIWGEAMGGSDLPQAACFPSGPKKEEVASLMPHEDYNPERKKRKEEDAA